jgi:aryl carrier-like protein
LRNYLAEKLPEYMVPAAYVRLESIPLNANGKVDRKALPAPAEDAYAARSYEAPQGEIETKLAEIWAEVLKVERIGRQDNFFELGGHSLLAIKLIDRMNQNGFRLNVRAIFETPSLAQLATSLVSENESISVPPNLIPGSSKRGRKSSREIELRI